MSVYVLFRLLGCGSRYSRQDRQSRPVDLSGGVVPRVFAQEYITTSCTTDYYIPVVTTTNKLNKQSKRRKQRHKASGHHLHSHTPMHSLCTALLSPELTTQAGICQCVI